MRADARLTLLPIVFLAGAVSGNWHEWWTYDGISGPSYWGVINPAWTMCNKGRQQSPVDVTPGHLVYDARFDWLE
jgi:carbonic anhydrase